MTPEQEERRGNEARALLNNAIYKEAYTAIRERLVGQLSLADLPEDTRAKCNTLLVALATVHRYFEQTMLTGQMAEIETQRKKTLRERIRAVV